MSALVVRWLQAMFVDPCIKRRDRWAWLVVSEAETPDACTVVGRAPKGVMLLGLYLL